MTTMKDAADSARFHVFAAYSELVKANAGEALREPNLPGVLTALASAASLLDSLGKRP